jgi:hypothetical protein
MLSILRLPIAQLRNFGSSLNKEKQMSSISASQLQRSDCLMPAGTEAAMASHTLNSGSRQRAMRQVAVGDLSFIYPDAVVASSQALDWQNLRAIEVQHHHLGVDPAPT